MPLQDSLLISVAQGVVELTATLVEPHRDDPSSFGEALQARLAEHQHQAMTDDSIMGEDLALASCVVCRDPIPDTLKESLLSSGFTPQDTPGGAQPSRSLFGRIGASKQRSRLEKWVIHYLRSAEIDPQLGGLESTLIDELPEGSLADTAEEGARLVIDGARTFFRLLLTARLESLEALEQHIDRLRRQKRGRWVVHPAAVRALAAYTTAVIFGLAPKTQWNDDEDDNPVWVQTRSGRAVATDPEYRVVEFVRRGLRSSLSDYVKDVVRQSENR